MLAETLKNSIKNDKTAKSAKKIIYKGRKIIIVLYNSQNNKKKAFRKTDQNYS